MLYGTGRTLHSEIRGLFTGFWLELPFNDVFNSVLIYIGAESFFYVVLRLKCGWVNFLLFFSIKIVK